MLWIFNAILLIFAVVACLGALASYRSPQIGGPEVINLMRAIKAGAWAVVLIGVVGMGVAHRVPAVDGWLLIALTLLAFADAASYTERMSELVRTHT